MSLERGAREDQLTDHEIAINGETITVEASTRALALRCAADRCERADHRWEPRDNLTRKVSSGHWPEYSEAAR